MQKFRKEFIPRNTELTEENLWMKDIPLDTREAAANKALDAYSTCFGQKKAGLIDKFNVGFRSKKYNDNIFYKEKNFANKSNVHKEISYKNISEKFDDSINENNNYNENDNCSLSISSTICSNFFSIIKSKSHKNININSCHF